MIQVVISRLHPPEGCGKRMGGKDPIQCEWNFPPKGSFGEGTITCTMRYGSGLLPEIFARFVGPFVVTPSFSGVEGVLTIPEWIVEQIRFHNHVGVAHIEVYIEEGT